MTSNNTEQGVPIPRAGGQEFSSNSRWWWFDRQKSIPEDITSTSPPEVESKWSRGRAGSLFPSSTPPSQDPPPNSVLSSRRASLPIAPSTWSYGGWRRSSVKCDDHDLIVSMRMPPM